MQYSQTSQILVDEHDVILSVIEAVEIVAQSLDESSFPSDFYTKAFDFFATFADKCHHGKEEAHLFPMLESRGILRHGGPVGCMLLEHVAGRNHVLQVGSALGRVEKGDLMARQTVKREALAFCDLLREHVQKENQILFVVGDQAMTEEDKELLIKKFECAEHSELPLGTHEKYVALAQELRVFAGLAPTTLTRSAGQEYPRKTRQDGIAKSD